MAKQNFTTGQILTANQMLDLQQTAMGGGAATAKTASYVLSGSDAGSTVAMDAAGATTITVNTALFAAGDTVFIQNLGAGLCTVTAGTATVSTAGSLILPQYDAGILYFTSASTAIFYDYIQTGATSPLTTKGDLYTFGTSDTRLGVGANGTTLVADSAEATGLKWQAASAGALTKINKTSFTAVSDVATDSLFSSTYDVYRIVLSFTSTGSNNIALNLRSGGVDTSTNYVLQTLQADDTTVNAARASTANFANFGSTGINAITIDMFNPNIASRTNYFVRMIRDTGGGATANQFVNACTQTDATQFTGIKFIPGTGTITGSFTVYGYEK